jgi:hypothetical protein
MGIPKYNAQAGDDQSPNLPQRLFWDWDFNKIDWQKASASVIARVLERGLKDDWQELVRFYGGPQINAALKNEIKYLPDFIIEDVCGYFNLKQEELACYAHKQSRKGHWI